MNVLAFRLPASHEPDCTVCGSTTLGEIGREVEGYTLMECGVCGVWSVHPRPSPASLRSGYDEEYYRPWDAQAPSRRRMWNRRVRLLKDFPRGRLLDVGCAEGHFLEAARSAGFDVAGTEVSTHGAMATASRLGVRIHCGELREARFAASSFSVVTLWHVLEHVLYPGETLREARRILRHDGRLVVAVPNRRCPAFRGAYRVARGRLPHLYHPHDREQHLHHWEPRSLRAALVSCGFAVDEVRPDPCALGVAKFVVDLAGRVHSRMASEPRTAAMVALARPGGAS